MTAQLLLGVPLLVSPLAYAQAVSPAVVGASGSPSGAAPATLIAPDPQSYLGARAAGRAGATGASQLTHDSLFQNPASAAFVKSYAVSVAYQATGNTLSASIVDTKSGPIGGGAFYMRRDMRSTSTDFGSNPSLGTLSRSEEHAGFSLLGQPAANVGVGANVRYSYLRSFTPGFANTTSWNVDVGMRANASDTLQLGLFGQSLLTDATGVLPRRFALGAEFSATSQIKISLQGFKVDAGSLAPGLTLPNAQQTTGWSAGIEGRLGQNIFARAGYLDNPAWRQKVASLGAGWLSETFSVDYAFQMGVQTSQPSSHSVVLTGYF